MLFVLDVNSVAKAQTSYRKHSISIGKQKAGNFKTLPQMQGMCNKLRANLSKVFFENPLKAPTETHEALQVKPQLNIFQYSGSPWFLLWWVIV